MTDPLSPWNWDASGGPKIDTEVAHGGRVYDYLLGGEDNFEVDRRAAEALGATLPGGLASAQANARVNRVFLGDAVRMIARAGVTQFLDVGAGIPTVDNTHLVARQVDPEVKVVYVDNDPMVVAHAHRLLSPDGRVTYIVEDMRDPAAVLSKAAAVLDLARPVGLMLIAALHMIPDGDRPGDIAASLVAGLPSGSYVALSHLTEDFAPDEVGRGMGTLRDNLREAMVARSRDQIAGFLDGLDLVGPGLVPIDEWVRAARRPPGPTPGWQNPLYVAVGRKP